MKIALDLQSFQSFLKINTKDHKTRVFDPVRRKYIILTPEEHVRQLLLQYLIRNKKISIHKLMVEKQIKVGALTKRFDIMIVDKALKPLVIIECKKPGEPIKNSVFEQISNYNQTLHAKYLMVSNGIEHYCARMNYKDKSYNLLQNLPDFAD